MHHERDWSVALVGCGASRRGAIMQSPATVRLPTVPRASLTFTEWYDTERIRREAVNMGVVELELVDCEWSESLGTFEYWVVF